MIYWIFSSIWRFLFCFVSSCILDKNLWWIAFVFLSLLTYHTLFILSYAPRRWCLWSGSKCLFTLFSAWIWIKEAVSNSSEAERRGVWSNYFFGCLTSRCPRGDCVPLPMTSTLVGHPFPKLLSQNSANSSSFCLVRPMSGEVFYRC